MSLFIGLFFLVLLLNQRWSLPLRLQASHCSTFRIMFGVPSIAVFCSESIVILLLLLLLLLFTVWLLRRIQQVPQTESWPHVIGFLSNFLKLCTAAYLPVFRFHRVVDRARRLANDKQCGWRVRCRTSSTISILKGSPESGPFIQRHLSLRALFAPASPTDGITDSTLNCRSKLDGCLPD